jgi:hypothetical protein
MQYRQILNNRRHKVIKQRIVRYLKGYNEIVARIIHQHYLFIVI